MKVTIIGSDRSLFVAGSESRERMVWLSSAFEEVQIVVFSLHGHNLAPERVSPNLSLHPTSSVSRVAYVRDAIRIACSVSRADVVSSQDPFEAGLAGYFAARRTRAKFHVQIHTDFLSPVFESGFLNRIRLRIARFVIPRADCIRVVSERIRVSLARAYPNARAVTVLPVFVDAEMLCRPAGRESAEHPKFKTVVLVVSRLERERNVALAVRSFAEAFRNRDDAGLVVVGSGREMDRLRALAYRLGISARVQFAGHERDVASYYAQADVVLNTSDYEGYGRVIVEALACGVPVVSTDVGIAREAGAIVASPHDFSRVLREAVESGTPGTLKLSLPSRAAYLESYRRAITTCIQ